MSPEREPMENDSNSRTAEELEQQTVDVYVERALHGPVFRMSYEHTHTYCEIFYLKSGTCTYTVNQGQWHLEAGDLFIVAAGDPHSTRYEGKTSCERIIVFCKADVLAGMMRGDPTEVQQALERSCKVILNAETRTMVEALLDQMLLENDLPRKYSEQVLELESLHLVLLLLRNGIFSHETMSPKEGYSADIERALKYIALNYQQPLTLEEVAGYCNLSPTYFSRKFRLITGQTFKEHVNAPILKTQNYRAAGQQHIALAMAHPIERFYAFPSRSLIWRRSNRLPWPHNQTGHRSFLPVP